MSSFPWEAIRARYEAGESARSISQSLGGRPSHQAIAKRKKSEGWARTLNEVAEVGMALPENILDNLKPSQQAVLRAIAQGMTQRTASQLAGVHENTVSEWKKGEDFAKAHQIAVGVKTGNRLAKVEQASNVDYRAAQWLLSRDPDSRSEWGQDATQVQGNTFNILGKVNLGIPR